MQIAVVAVFCYFAVGFTSLVTAHTVEWLSPGTYRYSCCEFLSWFLRARIARILVGCLRYL